MPPEPVAQPCEVCGVETTQRCSACVKAGIDLFFCSKEHQKLVWPGHKTVCGPGKAHPFPAVPLSQSELVWAKSHLDVFSIKAGSSLRKDLDEMRPPDGPTEAVLHQLVGDAYDACPLRNKLMLLTWTRHYFVREHGLGPIALADLARLGTGDRAHFSANLAANTCASIVVDVACAIADSGPLHLEHDESTWFSLVQHRALLLSRTIQLLGTGGDVMGLAPYIFGMKTRLFDWIRAGAGCDDVKIRRRLANFRAADALQS